MSVIIIMLALIMSGGKSSRLKKYSKMEKPLIEIDNQQKMIDIVLNSIQKVNLFNLIYVLTSHRNTPNTRQYLLERYQDKKNTIILNSKGKDYSTDLSFFLNSFKNKIIFVCSADLPLIDSKIIGDILERFNRINRKDNVEGKCVSILVEKEFVQANNIIPSIISTKRITTTKEYCYSGVSIFDTKNFHNKKIVNEEYIVINDRRLAVNINTKSDLVLTKYSINNNNNKNN